MKLIVHCHYYIRFNEDIQINMNPLSLFNGGIKLIDYSPFWKTLENSNENWYTLTKNHHISNSTLHRLKNNLDTSTKTLNDLCRILNCDMKDIIRYIPSENDQKL